MSLQGTLKTLGITEVLEFLSTRSASGRLDVTTEMGTASYGLVDGHVAESEYSFIRESGTDAAEATYYVVSELDGTFFFDEELAPEATEQGEDVPSLLSRTAEIAERWIEVEETVPSPNHLLTRNNELDSSVTIQPEWWKALEMIGDGRTSLQLASALDLSALDASLIALAMTNAGLLIVREVDPLEIEVDSNFAPIDEVPAQHDHLVSPAADDVDAGSPSGHSFDPDDSLPATDEVEIVQTLDVVDVEEPTPVVESSWESAGAPMSFSSPAQSIPEPVEAPMSFSNPDLSFSQPMEMADTPIPDEFAGRSGMDDLSELEYMVEPDGVVTSDPIHPPSEHIAHDDAPPHPPEQEIDDDGWSNGHVSTHDDLQPMTSAQVPTPTPITAPQAPVAEAPSVPSPFDVIRAPSEDPIPHDASGVPDASEASLHGFGAEMSLEDLPAPPAAHTEFAGDSAPIPETAVPTTVPAADDINAATTAMAGEVIDDLESLSDELNQSIPEDTNWELDRTFVPESNPAPPPVEGDPFGDLGELLNDPTDDERSSVLKFLRRD